MIFVLFREEITEKYNSKLTTEMIGPIFEVMSKLIKAVTGNKITVPGSFRRYRNIPTIVLFCVDLLYVRIVYVKKNTC